MAATSNATSAALPPTCPLCGWTFSLLDAATQTAHFLAHLIIKGGTETRTSMTPDW